MIRFCVERVKYQPNGERIVTGHIIDATVPELQDALLEVRTEDGQIVEYTKLKWAEVWTRTKDGEEPMMWRIAKTPSKRKIAERPR